MIEVRATLVLRSQVAHTPEGPQFVGRTSMEIVRPGEVRVFSHNIDRSWVANTFVSVPESREAAHIHKLNLDSTRDDLVDASNQDSVREALASSEEVKAIKRKGDIYEEVHPVEATLHGSPVEQRTSVIPIISTTENRASPKWPSILVPSEDNRIGSEVRNLLLAAIATEFKSFLATSYYNPLTKRVYY